MHKHSPHHPQPVQRREKPVMLYFEAPHYYRPQPVDGPKVFLAGGITGVESWQAKATVELERRLKGRGLVVFNPNRRNFPIGDPSAGWEQVSWEQHHLHAADVTLMWFPASDPTVTTQPIAMFELGQALGEGRRIVVGADPDYPRAADVTMLCQLTRPGMPVWSTLDDVIEATSSELDWSVRS